MNNPQIENINEFSATAAMNWMQLSDHTREQILSTVWCSRCCVEVRITAYSGALRSGELLLVGKCSICRNDVAKTIDLQQSDSELLG